MKRLAALVVLALPLFAAPADKTLPRAGETIEVSIVNLDVIVTDKAGQRVHGLTKDDFEVFEDGKPQPISNFAAYVPTSSSITDAKSAMVTPTTTASKREPRAIAIFIESFRLPQPRADVIFGALKKTLHDVVGRGDRVLIATWNLHTVVRLDYTDDLVAIDKALDAVGKESSGGMANPIPTYRAQIEDLKEWFGEAGSDAATHNLPVANDQLEFFMGAEANNAALMERTWMRDEARGINSFISTMANEEGRKALILMTHRFSRVAGGFYFFEKSKEPDLRTMNEQARVANYDICDTLKATANAHNVTIYAMYPPNLDNTAVVDPIQRKWQDDYTLGVDNRILNNEIEALKDLTDATGGSVAWGSVDIANQFARIRDDFEDYYSLAYRVGSRKDDRSRSVTVKAKNPAYVVRTRKQFFAKSDDGRIRDQVIAALYHEPAPSGITVTATIGEAVPQQKYRYKVPVDVRVPMNQFMTDDSATPKGAFTVYLATGRYVGDTSEITKQTIPFTITDVEKANSGYFTYHFTLSTDVATNRLAVGVYDEISHDSGFARVDLPRIAR